MQNNPFYVPPGNDFSEGLRGLLAGVMSGQQSRERSAALESKNKAAEAALAAYKTNDPDKIAEAMIMNPEIASTLGKAYEMQVGYNKEKYASSLEKMLTEIEKTDTLTEVEKPLYDPNSGLSGALGGSYPGQFDPSKQGQKLTTKEDIVRSIFKKNPEAAKKIIEYEFATASPKKYEAWKKIHDPEEKTSPLKKMIDERKALLDSGKSKDDPEVKAYDSKIWPEDKEKDVAPSGLKKMMDERDALIAGGADPNNPDVLAYNNKIMGELGDKKFGPSPLRKLIKERQEYLEAGEDPKGPIIRAYDNKIAGIDIDIDQLTQDEIDMWGAWVNLTGKMPSVGRGKQATKIRAGILKSAAAQAMGDTKFGQDAKRTPSEAALEVVVTQADTKSIQGALNFLEKQTGAMGSFIQNMDAQINQITALSEDLYTFDTRLLNWPLRTVRGKIIGSPLQAKYDMYLTEIEQEIGRLASGGVQSIAELSTGAQERWDKIHDKNLSVKDMLSLLSETRHAAELRLKSVNDQLNRTRQKLRTRDYGGVPQVSSQEEYNALKSGDTYINKNTGKQMRKP